jgi:hypothetical protein
LLANYVLRRKNPTPFIANFVTKSYFDSWGGGAAILSRLERTPPDYFMFLHRAPEFSGDYEIGGPRGYARAVLDWIEKNYVVIDRIGPVAAEAAKYNDDFASLQYVLLKKKAE